MPTEKAVITARGIKLRGKEMYYSCERAVKEQWFERARSNVLSSLEKSIRVVYDFRNPNFVYLLSPDGRDFEKCFLIDTEGRYSNKSFHDIDYLIAYEKLQSQRNQGRELQKKVDLIADIENIVARAEEMAEPVMEEKTSNKQRLSGIRDNRINEKAKRREDEGFEVSRTESARDITSSIDTNTQTLDKTGSLKPNHFDLLRQKRQERQGGHEE